MLNIGQKVMFLDYDMHNKYPMYFRPVNTVGIVVDIDTDCRVLPTYKVEWPDNCGVCGIGGDYGWWCSGDQLETINEKN